MGIDNQKEIFLVVKESFNNADGYEVEVVEAWRNEEDAEDSVYELGEKDEEGHFRFFVHRTFLNGWDKIES